MKKIIISLVFLFASTFLFAQEEEVEDSPVRKPFNSTVLIDNHTHLTPSKGSFGFIIYHRFGLIEDVYDLYGIYAPSNIRLGLNYGITDKLMIGAGYEKNNMQLDAYAKYAIFRQTRSGKVPVSLTYLAMLNIDTRQDPVFGENYQFTNRFGYFHQLILGRKFTKKFSVQGTASFSHFNAVDSVWHNDKAGVSIGGKYNVYNNIHVVAEYDFPISLKTVRYYQKRVKPNLAFGIEIATSTHSFQVFAANYSHINPAKNYVFNTHDFTEGEFLLGFNIVVRL